MISRGHFTNLTNQVSGFSRLNVITCEMPTVYNDWPTRGALWTLMQLARRLPCSFQGRISFIQDPEGVREVIEEYPSVFS
jgi:hypothetical protein